HTTCCGSRLHQLHRGAPLLVRLAVLLHGHRPVVTCAKTRITCCGRWWAGAELIMTLVASFVWDAERSSPLTWELRQCSSAPVWGQIWGQSRRPTAHFSGLRRTGTRTLVQIASHGDCRRTMMNGFLEPAA